MAKRLDENGILYFIGKMLLLFQRQEAGKGLSTNDLTNELKTMIQSPAWANITGAPNFQTGAQVAAAIAAALSQVDTNIFVVVNALPAVGAANTNKIYVLAGDGTEWFIKNGAWEQVGEAAASLEGYFNEANLVPITNAEIDQMIAGLVA